MLNKARTTITIALALSLVALIGVLPASAQQNPSATRSFSSTSVAPGADVTVTIAVANYGGFGRVAETLPAGFTYKSTSGLDESQVDTSRGQEVRFTLQGERSFSYVVTASSTAGSHTFSGELRDSDRVNHNVTGATRVTVRAPVVQRASATRSFSSTSVNTGADVTVTIRASNYGGFGRVTETLPDGFTYKSSSLEDSQVDASGGQIVKFTLQSDSSFTYVVTASDMAGSYTFSGELRDSDRNNHDVTGATRVTVKAPPGPASRSFSPSAVAPNGTVMVTIRASNYGGFGRVTETLPDGFTYKSTSLDDDSQVDTSGGQVIKFTLQGETSFTYTVTAPGSTRAYTFSGTFRDSDRKDTNVGGASRVTVRVPPTPTPEPTPEPTPDPTPVATPTATATPDVGPKVSWDIPSALVPNVRIRSISPETTDDIASYKIVKGRLPLLLRLDETTGVISGRPTRETVMHTTVTIEACDTSGDCRSIELRFPPVREPEVEQPEPTPTLPAQPTDLPEVGGAAPGPWAIALAVLVGLGAVALGGAVLATRPRRNGDG